MTARLERSRLVRSRRHAKQPGRPLAVSARVRSMPASVASTTPSKAGRGGNSGRKERAAVSQLASSLKKNREVDKKSDFQYIVERLDTEDAGLVPDLAGLLRNNTLRKAIDELLRRSSGDTKGKELPPSQQHFKALRGPTLNAMLEKYEPKVLQEMSRDTKVKLVTFGLGVSVKEGLPSLRPALRFTNVLASYTKIRYDALGKRLQAYDPNSENPIGYFSLSDTAVSMTLGVEDCEGGTEIDLSTFGSASDWALVDNNTHQATLHSEENSLTVLLAPRFKKAGFPALPAETLEWNIAPASWPKEMKEGPLSSEQVEEAPPAKKRKPRGGGKVSIPGEATPAAKKKKNKSGSD